MIEPKDIGYVVAAVVILVSILAFNLGPHKITGWLEDRKNFPAICRFLGAIGILGFTLIVVINTKFEVTWPIVPGWLWLLFAFGVLFSVIFIGHLIYQTFWHRQEQMTTVNQTN